jgi:hypothetical protein
MAQLRRNETNGSFAKVTVWLVAVWMNECTWSAVCGENGSKMPPKKAPAKKKESKNPENGGEMVE